MTANRAMRIVGLCGNLLCGYDNLLAAVMSRVYWGPVCL